jgi:rare lipoprotein A
MYRRDHYGLAHLVALFDARLKHYRSKARLLRRWLPIHHEVRIVEVGSFVGGFLAAGQEYGWNMLGVDPGAEVNNFCRRKGLSVFHGMLAECPLTERSVDCVSIWNPQIWPGLCGKDTVLGACRLRNAGERAAIGTTSEQRRNQTVIISRSMRQFFVVMGVLFSVLLNGCSGMQPQPELPPPPPVSITAPGPVEPPVPEETAKPERQKVQQVGEASWYGPPHQGKETASGETFNQNELTAAHPTLPLGTTATVTNLETGKSVKVKINDRGPYVKGRKIDLSRAAARKLGMTKKGVTKVKIVSTVARKAKKKFARQQTKSSHPKVEERMPMQMSAEE